MSQSALRMLGGIAVYVMLYQSKTLRPYLVGVGIIVILGLLLTRYPTIREQFVNLGGASGTPTGGGGSGGAGHPLASAN